MNLWNFLQKTKPISDASQPNAVSARQDKHYTRYCEPSSLLFVPPKRHFFLGIVWFGLTGAWHVNKISWDMSNDCRIWSAQNWFEVGINKKIRGQILFILQFHVHFTALSEMSCLGAGSGLGIPNFKCSQLRLGVSAGGEMGNDRMANRDRSWTGRMNIGRKRGDTDLKRCFGDWWPAFLLISSPPRESVGLWLQVWKELAKPNPAASA